MKSGPVRVILVRHAHAEWPDYHGTDFNRPLTALGIEQAEVTAAAIANTRERPQRILASPALRALQTAQIIARALAFGPDSIELIPELYNASSAVLEKAVQQQAQRHRLLLVAHNPGISDLARKLSEEPARAFFNPSEWQTVEVQLAV